MVWGLFGISGFFTSVRSPVNVICFICFTARKFQHSCRNTKGRWNIDMRLMVRQSAILSSHVKITQLHLRPQIIQSMINKDECEPANVASRVFHTAHILQWRGAIRLQV